MKLALPFIIIAISIGVYFVYISPTVEEVRVLSAKKVEYSNALVGAEELKTKRDNVLIDYNNISGENIDKLNKIVPETFNSVLFANDVNAIASGYGLIVKDFKINEPKTDVRDVIINQPANRLYKTTVVTFSVDGQYGSFVKFIQNLESSLHLVDITGLSMKTLGGQKSADSPLQFLLEMNTYSLR